MLNPTIRPAQRGVIAGLLCLAAWLAWFDSWPQNSRPAAQSPSASHGAKEQDNDQHDGGLWNWLTHDATGYFTAWLVIVGGGQLTLFYVQLRFIRESLDAAKESADTAKTQAEIAREALKTSQDTAIRQLRAYVFAEPEAFQNRLYPIASRGVGLQPYRGVAGSGRKISFVIVFRNSGQTPAYKFQQSTSTDVFDEPATEANFAIKPESEAPISRATLAAGATARTRRRPDQRGRERGHSRRSEGFLRLWRNQLRRCLSTTPARSLSPRAPKGR